MHWRPVLTLQVRLYSRVHIHLWGLEMSVLFYNDPTLNEVMSCLISFERESVFQALNHCIFSFQKQLIIDERYMIAGGIIQSMIHNCKRYGKKCPYGKMESQIEKIVNAIRPSLRWKTFSKFFWQWIGEFDLISSGLEDFKILNEFEELWLGIVSFADMETRKKNELEHSFRRFVKETGLKNYDRFLNVFSVLVDIERRFENKPILYSEEEIAKLEHDLGLEEGILVLGEERLNDLRLSEMHQSIIPMFFGGRPGMRDGVQRQSLALLNLPQRLCFALDQPRERIIEGAYKGPVFEDFLCNILRGELVVAIDPTDPLGGYIQRADRLLKLPGGKELLDKLKDSQRIVAWEEVSPRGWKYYVSKPELREEEMRFVREFIYIRYNYKPPPNVNGNCSLIIKAKTHPNFQEFLKAEEVSEWEEDLLLMHNDKPQHCLIAQAKFTVKYSHKKYIEGRNHIRRFAEYIERNMPAKLELGVPKDFKLLPVLFTSFTGAIHKDDDGVLKTTIFPLLKGEFSRKISRLLQ